jgi:hypothetical protein
MDLGASTISHLEKRTRTSILRETRVGRLAFVQWLASVGRLVRLRGGGHRVSCAHGSIVGAPRCLSRNRIRAVRSADRSRIERTRTRPCRGGEADMCRVPGCDASASSMRCASMSPMESGAVSTRRSGVSSQSRRPADLRRAGPGTVASGSSSTRHSRGCHLRVCLVVRV